MALRAGSVTAGSCAWTPDTECAVSIPERWECGKMKIEEMNAAAATLAVFLRCVPHIKRLKPGKF
jgi:hypothetical protein